MNPDPASVMKPASSGLAEKTFTVAHANRTLPLVSRIVGDIVTRYRQLLTLREERHALALLPGQVATGESPRANSVAVATDSLRRDQRLGQLDRQLAELHETLADLEAELSGVGCVLKDWADGLVDFPAVYQGRRIWLCWRLGEPAVAYWHEGHAGYAGRRPIPDDFT